MDQAPPKEPTVLTDKLGSVNKDLTEVDAIEKACEKPPAIQLPTNTMIYNDWIAKGNKTQCILDCIRTYNLSCLIKEKATNCILLWSLFLSSFKNYGCICVLTG